MTTFFVAVLWLFSLCLHEFSHAWVAYHGGDTSVRDKGYLSFNPLRYAHPTMSLLFPLLILLMGGIALPGGAVYIDRSRLRSREWESATSLAGPASNLVLALLLCLPFMLGFRPSGEGWFWPAYSFFALIQCSAVVMNLIPIPGLDGFGALSPWLPRALGASLNRQGNIGMWIVFLVLWNVQPVNEAFWKVVYAVSGALGVSPDLAEAGFEAFQFWKTRR